MNDAILYEPHPGKPITPLPFDESGEAFDNTDAK
jgi:hypothetical protein